VKRSVLVVLSVMLLTGLSPAVVRSSSSRSAASPRVPSTEQITPLPNGDLYVHLDDPPPGMTYDTGNDLAIPAGFQWRLLMVSFNITTSAGSTGAQGSRRLKFVLRDSADLVGNAGRGYTIVIDSLRDYVYKDCSMSIGQNSQPGKLGPGTPGAVIRSPMEGALPDMWVPSGFEWVVTFEGGTDRDQMSEFYAIVQQQPV
jgi:hypothetical protein